MFSFWFLLGWVDLQKRRLAKLFLEGNIFVTFMVDLEVKVWSKLAPSISYFDPC